MDAEKTSLLTTILITSIVLGIIIIYFFATIIRQQRRNIELYKSKIKAEITAQENERKRIAADLHDELGPVLSSVKFKINSLDIANNEDQEVLDNTNKNIDSMMVRMREISNDLMPNTLIRKGLVMALEEFIPSVNKSNGLEIKFAYSNVPDLSAEKAINLYRILQEIIHNTIKHANASDLRIELKGEKNTIILLTEDNGKGFDYNRISKDQKGLGLRNLLSRTEVIGGSMYVESQPNKGAKYTFEIPL